MPEMRDGGGIGGHVLGEVYSLDLRCGPYFKKTRKQALARFKKLRYCICPELFKVYTV
jgi:hypothetical protein